MIWAAIYTSSPSTIIGYYLLMIGPANKYLSVVHQSLGWSSLFQCYVHGVGGSISRPLERTLWMGQKSTGLSGGNSLLIFPGSFAPVLFPSLPADDIEMAPSDPRRRDLKLGFRLA